VSCELQPPIAGSIVGTILYRDLPIRQVVLEHDAAMRWADLWQTKWKALGWTPSHPAVTVDLRQVAIDGIN
jgi:hypothetical protein